MKCALCETYPFLWTLFAVLPPALLRSQRPIRSTSIIGVLNSTAILQSIPHCMFSLFACTSAFCCGTVVIPDVKTLVSANLGTLRAKLTHASEDSGVLGYDSVPFGECFPTLGITDLTTRSHFPEDLNTKKHCCENHKSHIKPAMSQDGYRGVVTCSMWRQCYMRIYWNKPLDKHTIWNYLQSYYIFNLILP